MKINLLNQWKKDFDWYSSILNPDKFCDRKDVEGLVKTLLEYFGEEYFEVTINQNRSLEKTNWVFNLLAQKDLSSLIALFEIGNLLEYLKSLDVNIQKKLRSAVNSFNEFQNLLFEIYTYRLLDFNKIENQKKIWKGNQELEGTCTIGDKDFIFECCKSYTVDFERFDVINNISTQIFLEMQKMKVAVGLIGYVVIKGNIKEAQKKILKIIKQYFGQFNGKQDYIRSMYEDDDCLFETLIYDEEKYFELTNQEDRPEITFKIIPPITIVQGVANHFRTEITPTFSITQEKITDKLLKIIRKKRHQHNPSKDCNRIIFIANEMAKNFRFPLMSFENMLEEEKIQKVIDKKETNDIICVILRNYLGEVPSVKVKVFCKDEFKEVKSKLENMKTRFGYSINEKRKRW